MSGSEPVAEPSPSGVGIASTVVEDDAGTEMTMGADSARRCPRVLMLFGERGSGGVARLGCKPGSAMAEPGTSSIDGISDLLDADRRCRREPPDELGWTSEPVKNDAERNFEWKRNDGLPEGSRFKDGGCQRPTII